MAHPLGQPLIAGLAAMGSVRPWFRTAMNSSWWPMAAKSGMPAANGAGLHGAAGRR